MKTQHTTRWWGVALVAAVLTNLGGVAMAVDEAKFVAVSHDGAFAVRDYAPVLLAEVSVSGTRDEALNKGFRLLADYIFGNTKPALGSMTGGKIAMTAPVVQTPAPAKIAMTTPVLQTQAAPDRWLVHFVMPANYTSATLPQPVNNAVKILEQPSERVAVLTFNGWVNDKKLAARERELRAWIAARGLTSIGNARHAYYNPPWTLPWWRRNEILIEIKR